MKQIYRDWKDDPVAEKIAWLMDRSIRIGPFSIGLDGLLGLIPGIGDMASGMISAIIIARALEANVPRAAIIRMVINVGVDSLVGSIPFLGDLFDFAYKANVRNVEIYRTAIRGDRRAARDWTFILAVVLIMLAFISLPIIGLLYLGRLLGPSIF